MVGIMTTWPKCLQQTKLKMRRPWSRSPSCRCSATSRRACSSGPSGSAPGTSSAARTPAPSTRPRRPDPRAAEVRLGRLPLARRLAAPRQARRAQGALGQLPRLRARRRPHPRRRLGRLGPPPAGPGAGLLLRPHEDPDGWPAAASSPCSPASTSSFLAGSVAQRHPPRLRPPHGRLLPRLPPRRGPGPRPDHRANPHLGAARQGQAQACRGRKTS